AGEESNEEDGEDLQRVELGAKDDEFAPLRDEEERPRLGQRRIEERARGGLQRGVPSLPRAGERLARRRAEDRSEQQREDEAEDRRHEADVDVDVLDPVDAAEGAAVT